MPLYGLSEIHVSAVNLIIILHHGEVLQRIYSNTVGARPLAEDLGHDSEHNPKQVRLDCEKLAEWTRARGAHGSFTFAIELVIDVDDFAGHVRVFSGKFP